MQTLPHDIESEKAILSISMWNPKHFARAMEMVGARHFYDPACREIFLAMKELHGQGKAFAVEDLRKKADVFPSQISELMGFAPAMDPKPYCDSVLDTWRRREAIGILHEAEGRWMSKRGSINTISEIQASLIGLCKGTETNLFTLEQSLFSAYETICTSVESREFPGVPSHLPALNKVIGGFRKGNLIVLGARPGVGKTAIAVNFAHHLLKQGSKVLFISAEMTKEEIATRMLSIESGVSADLLINKPNLLQSEQLEAISRVVSKLAREQCFVLDEPNVRSDRLFLAAASAEQQMAGLDLVVVDYLQILEGRTKQHIRSKADYMAEIVKDLKALAKRHDVSILALAQLNRDSEQGKPSLRHFADSSQLEKEADVAMILWKEKMDLGSWNYQLLVEKNRNGETGLIRLHFDERRMYFSEQTQVEEYS